MSGEKKVPGSLTLSAGSTTDSPGSAAKVSASDTPAFPDASLRDYPCGWVCEEAEAVGMPAHCPPGKCQEAARSAVGAVQR